jgi:hypothetical protein
MSKFCEFEFSKGYSADKPCPYQIGQFVPQFYPMNYEASIALTKTSFDVIIGLANPGQDSIDKFMEEINFFLFSFDDVPVLTVWNGYYSFPTYVNVFENEYAEPKDWVEETDDEVNIVIIDDHKLSYKVVGIRKVKLPLMKRIREICREQIKLPTRSMVDSAFDRIMCFFSDYARNKYHEEECRFGEVSDGDIQTGTHKIISIDRENIKADVNPLAVPYLLEHKTKEHIKRMELKMKGFPHDSENKR